MNYLSKLKQLHQEYDHQMEFNKWYNELKMVTSGQTYTINPNDVQIYKFAKSLIEWQQKQTN